MKPTKRTVVFTVEPAQLEQIRSLVRAGEYRNISEFLRQAVGEKLSSLMSVCLEAQLARYCSEGYGDEDRDLVELQAFNQDE